MKRGTLPVLFLLLSLPAFAQTAVYPTAPATDANLFVQVNGIQTALTSTLASGGLTAAVASCAGILPNTLVTIGVEIAPVTNCTGNVLNFTSRGFDGTAAATHASGAAVSLYVEAWHHNSLRVEVEALEQRLYTGGSPTFANLTVTGTCTGCGGGGGGGTPGGATTQVQYNNAGAFAGSANLTWNNGNAQLIVNKIGSSSGVISPVFNANITGLSGTNKTFQNSDGSFTVDYTGQILGQSAIMHGAFNSQADIFGGNAFQTSTGTFTISGSGNAAFQSLALTNGWTAGSGAYGLTAGGALSVASCTGCGGGGGGGVPNINISHTFVGTQELSYTHNLNTLNPVYSCYDGTTPFSGIAPGVNLTTPATVNITYITATDITLACSFNNSGTGGGTAAGSSTQVQFNTGGVFNASANFTFNSGTNVMAVLGGVVGTLFNCTATGSANCIQQQTGTFSITGAGNALLQTATANTTFNSLADVNGGNAFQTSTGTMSIAGNGNGLFQNLVVNSLFNSQADVHGGNAFQTSTGTMSITGAGVASFQSLVLTNGFTAGSGAYGLTGGGALTVASCSGCGGGGSAAGSNTQVQYNNSGAFGASAGFTFNSGTNVLTTTGGMASLVFNCTATGSANCVQQQAGNFTISGAGNGFFQNVTVNSAFNSQADIHGGNAFQTSTGTMTITGAGAALFQSLSLTNGWTAGSGAYGLTGGGALTVASCTGCGGGGGSPGGSTTQVQYNNAGAFAGSANFTFNNGTNVLTATGGMVSVVHNCTATGGTNCVQQQSGTFTITGAGNAAFQGLQVAGGTTLNSGLTISAGGLGVSGGLLISSGGFSAITGLFSSTLTQNGITGSGGISAGSFGILGSTIIDGSQNVNVLGHVNTAGGFQVSGTPGVTSSTCSSFRLGICIAP